MKQITIFVAGIALGAVLMLAALGRYEAIKNDHGVATRFDRWTGHVAICEGNADPRFDGCHDMTEGVPAE